MRHHEEDPNSIVKRMPKNIRLHQLVCKVGSKLVERALSICRDKRYDSREHRRPGRGQSTSLEPGVIESNDLTSRNGPLGSGRTNLVVGSLDNERE